ncbi:MAG: type II toxin-antitoxin system RelE/ParE family toxin [Hyphomonadaceae bacterium]|nr:type II toxin-antitoxin system RelE/ParE family toxin [Hyphomonadaceae bacterium]
MVIEWSLRAQSDLERIVADISRHSPAGAKRVLDRIRKRVDDLNQFSAQGVARPRHVYRLDIARTPYFALYRISSDKIVILKVIHGRRNRRS